MAWVGIVTYCLQHRGIAGVLFWRLGQWLFWKPQVAPHIFIENMEIDLILPLTNGMDYTNLTHDQWLDPFSFRDRQAKRPYRPFTALQVGSLKEHVKGASIWRFVVGDIVEFGSLGLNTRQWQHNHKILTMMTMHWRGSRKKWPASDLGVETSQCFWRVPVKF